MKKITFALAFLLIAVFVKPALAGYTPPDKEDGSPDRTGDAGSELVLQKLPSPPPGDNRRD